MSQKTYINDLEISVIPTIQGMIKSEKEFFEFLENERTKIHNKSKFMRCLFHDQLTSTLRVIVKAHDRSRNTIKQLEASLVEYKTYLKNNKE